MHRFRFGPAGGHPSNPWFRIGALDVTTTVLAIAAVLLSFIVYAVDRATVLRLALLTSEVRDGELWRVLTWPLYNRPSGWAFISLILFFLWGSQIEDLLGRKRMAWLIGWMTIVPAAILVVATAQPESGGGMRWIGVAFFLLFAIEFPGVRFFFNIPAWVLALGFVAIDVLGLLGDRFYDDLFLYVLVIGTGVVVMRQFGLAIATASVIPQLWKGSGATRRPAQPRRAKGKRSKAPLSVVPDWTSPRQSMRDAEAEVNELLDKIARSGMDSLTPEERRRLNDASRRMRDDRG